MARIRRSPSGGKGVQQEPVWQVGIYIRLSREDGNEESESITNQRKILLEQLPNYLEGGYGRVEEYIDDGRTGTSDDTRPAFLRLVADVKRGKINCIVTKNLSRAFRNSANQGKFLEEFIPLYHTRFISLYEPHMDTYLNPEVVHSLEVSITGFLNEQYAYKTSVDVRRTFETKRKKGEFIGAFAPYGLKKCPEDKNRLLIDEEAAQVVRTIFHWFVHEGMSKNGIAKRLNTLGIPNPTAYKRQKGFLYCNPQSHRNDGLWSGKTVCSILLNEMYIGNMVQGRQKVISYKVHDRVATQEKDWYIVPQTHDAIVDRDTFQKAQMLHRRDTRAAPQKTTLPLFSGLLYCADCKKAMTRKRAKQFVYYHCSTYERKSKTACTRHTIREDVLEQAVLKGLQMQLAHMDLSSVREEPKNLPMAHTQTEHLLSAQKKEQEKYTAVLDRLYMDWCTGEVSQTAYERRKTKLEGQLAHIQQVIAHLEQEAAEQNQTAVTPQKSCFQNGILCHLERGLLVALVHAIEVHEGGGLTVQFNGTDPFLGNR